MTGPYSARYKVPVFPGLFLLANVSPQPGPHPMDLVDDLLTSNRSCAFCPNGIAFNSTFEAHQTAVTMRWSPDGPMPDGGDVEHGTIIIGSEGMRFENPDQVVATPVCRPPVVGRTDVRIQRLTVGTAADEVAAWAQGREPSGLEEWKLHAIPHP